MISSGPLITSKETFGNPANRLFEQSSLQCCTFEEDTLMPRASKADRVRIVPAGCWIFGTIDGMASLRIPQLGLDLPAGGIWVFCCVLHHTLDEQVMIRLGRVRQAWNKKFQSSERRVMNNDKQEFRI